MAKVENGSVTFKCWSEDKEYEADTFWVIAGDWGPLLRAECPYCDKENHTVESNGDRWI